MPPHLLARHRPLPWSRERPRRRARRRGRWLFSVLTALRPPPGVAPQGRRLQRGVPWVPIIVGGGVVLFWLFTQVGGALRR